jgi:predicted transcriptional regulator
MISINLSSEIQTKLEQLANSKGWSLDEVVEKAVLAFVDEEKATELPLIVNQWCYLPSK